MAGEIDTSVMLGLGKVEESVKILLDIERALSPGELSTVAITSESSDVSDGGAANA